MKTLNLVPRDEMSRSTGGNLSSYNLCIIYYCKSSILSQMINKPPLLFKGRKLISPPPISLLSIPPRPFLFFTNKW